MAYGQNLVGNIHAFPVSTATGGALPVIGKTVVFTPVLLHNITSEPSNPYETPIPQSSFRPILIGIF